MRRSVRKHYEKLARFVDVANLGWLEILENNNFPMLEELTSGRKHRALLQRIDRALRSSFPSLKIPDRVPPLFHKDWSKCPSSSWRRFHSYALVRRVFDSLDFLVSARSNQRRGVRWMQVSLQTEPVNGGTILRVHDPYEDFLAALEDHDQERLRACPVCRLFFVALRLDQKACKPRCANRLRVGNLRKKREEYLSNRKFRARTGLTAVRHGRRQLLGLHQATRTESVGSASEDPLLPELPHK